MHDYAHYLRGPLYTLEHDTYTTMHTISVVHYTH